MLALDAVYLSLARPWSVEELADRYQSAYRRGAADLPAGGPPPNSPIALLATAIPRLSGLAVAANVLHLLPERANETTGLVGELLATIDQTAAGGLRRCQLALDADARACGYDAHGWLALTYDQAAEWRPHASSAADQPP